MTDTWYARNKERAAASHRAWCASNREQRTASVSAWNERNRERRRAISKKWRDANKERQRAGTRAWGLQNRERRLVTNRAWRAANRVLWRSYEHDRRARELDAPGQYTEADILRLFDQQRGICAAPHCNTLLTVSCTVDHKLPLSRDGTNWPHNLQLLCKSCNSSKRDKTMEEWLCQSPRLSPAT
jgi:5-methylcytosine-specific restriction endonuclease McrA